MRRDHANELLRHIDAALVALGAATLQRELGELLDRKLIHHMASELRGARELASREARRAPGRWDHIYHPMGAEP